MKYFTISESPGGHIGTVKASNALELNNGTIEACRSHFDSEVSFPCIDIKDYINGKSGTLELAADNIKTEIFIQETWIY